MHVCTTVLYVHACIRHLMAFIRMQVQLLSDQDTDAQHFMRFSTEISKQVTAARASACACCSRGFKAHSDAVTAPDSWPLLILMVNINGYHMVNDG